MSRFAELAKLGNYKYLSVGPDDRTYLWWRFLCLTAAINVVVWLWAIYNYSKTGNFAYAQPILSGVYVLICAFRSFYPRIDLERYCLFDTPLSSVVLGRTCATIAEICFSIQCAIVIYDLGAYLQSPTISFIAYLIVPIIVLAQGFCWYAALTLQHIWHGVEEFAWIIMILLATFCFFNGFIALTGMYKLVMFIAITACLGSAYIMLFIDIPMYLSRQREELQAGRSFLTIGDGFRDALSRRVHTDDWSIWKKEAIWITTYFTFGVWLSISMVLVDFNA
jgi:hypothetical protein